MAGYETAVAVTRNKTAVPTLQFVPCWIENISPIVIASAGGKIPNNSYWFYSRQGVPDVRLGDLLTDLNGVKYRVSGNPEPGDQSFLRVMIDKNMVNTP